MKPGEVWAPHAEQVTLLLPGAGDSGERVVLRPGDDGVHRSPGLVLAPGTDYCFLLDSDPTPLPDPRSAWQPAGVHGPSRVPGPYTWGDAAWSGRPLAGSVLYELHIGTFTPDGTFDAALGRLPHLVALGVDAVELLPVAAFPGRHGWGYDGVDLFAVHEPYGGPDGLRRFVDGCHAAGVAVVLDVVYNHVGPDGNYLSRFGPYFTDTHHTPWGPAVNLDAAGSDDVRRFLLDNATHWLRDYHLDGLRLDAVHAFADTRARTLLEELSAEVHALGAGLGRPLWLIAESDLNDPRLVRSLDAGGLGLDGVWCDDIHHALHTALTGERQGYYADFGSLTTLAQALTGMYVHAGGWSSFRGRSHGRPVGDLPRDRFVTYLQDHDQIGNRAAGERLAQLCGPRRAMVGAALLLCGAATPMLFMGEEWAASTPWLYFTDHQDPALADAVRTGRRAEFAGHGWAADDVPDPQDPGTVAASVLRWDECPDLAADDTAGAAAAPATGDPEGQHAQVLRFYQRLLRLRRQTPDLRDGRADSIGCTADDDAGTLVMHRGAFRVVANLAGEARAVDVDGIPVEVLLASESGFSYTAGSVTVPAESVVVLRVLTEPVPAAPAG